MKLRSSTNCAAYVPFIPCTGTNRKHVMQIMIVEDNEKVRAMYRTLLAHITSDIVEARNGLEAVRLYPDSDPDVVLMDIRMPVMDGIDATRAIVKLDRNACILIVTEYDEPLYRKDARDAGACAYFLKNSLMDLRHHLQALAREINGNA